MVFWILKEIRLRKLNATLIALSVCAATAILIGSTAVSQAYNRSLEQEFETRKTDLEKQMHQMWNEYRKMTKDLGFNVLILPREQNLADFYAEDFSSQYMPESYAEKLASSTSVTIQHILPALIQKTWWPEKKRSVLIYGVRGELTRLHFPKANKKSPILQPVNPGEVVCGYELSRGLGLKAGSKITIHGTPFTVSKCHEQRGNRDDITLWIDLATAQKMFDKEDKINAILALECRCSSDQNLPNVAKIRADLEKILPGTQVLEFMSEVIARAEARYAAHRTKETALSSEISHADKSKKQRGIFLMGLFIIFASASIFMVSFLTLYNVRSRLQEIGILRAIGFSSLRLVFFFSGKLFLLGLLGALTGIIIGLAAAELYTSKWNISIVQTEQVLWFALTAAGMTAINAGAGLIPVLRGVNQSTALLLRETK